MNFEAQKAVLTAFILQFNVVFFFQSEIEHLSQCMQEFLMQRSVFPQQATSSAVHSPNQCSAALQHNYYNESNQSNTDPGKKKTKLEEHFFRFNLF